MCMIEGCEGKVRSQGLCERCYGRLRYNGEIEMKSKETEGAFVKHGRGRMQYVVGFNHQAHSRARIVAMFVLGRNLFKSGLEVHHNDGDIINDMPSNLAVCTITQHRILDAVSRLRREGAALPVRPGKDFVPSLEGVIWLADFGKDHAGIYLEAIAWWKDKMLWEWHGQVLPQLEGGVDRRI